MSVLGPRFIGIITLSCRYYLYKLPKDYSKYESENAKSNGLRYLNISSATASLGWKLSERTIDDASSFPGRTISNLLNNPDIVFIAYNDEPPQSPVDFENGHTKGVIGADSKSGIWLIHSVPKYPDISAYSYPQTGAHYGQSFLCLSFNASQMDLVGKQQIFNEPNIYHSQIPDGLRDTFPNLVKAVNQEWQKEAPYWNYETLETRGRVKFASFAKGRKFRKELYEDWVAPTLGAGLLVESWRHGPGVLPSNCTRKQQ